MSIAENLIGSLVKQLGIDPVHLTSILNNLVAEMNGIHADRLAFKTSAVAVVAEFRVKLDRIETRLDGIDAAIRALSPPAENASFIETAEPQPLNGAQIHE